jgi:hypothetical protein
MIKMDDKKKELTLKQRLLQGKRNTEEFVCEELGETLVLRALDDGEFHKVKHMQYEGIEATGKAGTQDADVKFDLAAMTSQRYLVACQVVAFGLSVDGDKWSIAEVKQLSPPGVVDKIAMKVIEITGAEEQLDFFRTDGKRAGVDVNDTPGLPFGEDSA